MSDFLWLMVFILIVVPIIAGALYSFQARRLSRGFADLGVLKGLTRGRIVSTVGEPMTEARIDATRVALTWRVPGYTITLIFDGRICEGVADERRSQIRTA